LVETIEKTVAKGKKVTLISFGTFEPRKRTARVDRNPKPAKNSKLPLKQCQPSRRARNLKTWWVALKRNKLFRTLAKACLKRQAFCFLSPLDKRQKAVLNRKSHNREQSRG